MVHRAWYRVYHLTMGAVLSPLALVHIPVSSGEQAPAVALVRLPLALVVVAVGIGAAAMASGQAGGTGEWLEDVVTVHRMVVPAL